MTRVSTPTIAPARARRGRHVAKLVAAAGVAVAALGVGGQQVSADGRGYYEWSGYTLWFCVTPGDPMITPPSHCYIVLEFWDIQWELMFPQA